MENIKKGQRFSFLDDAFRRACARPETYDTDTTKPASLMRPVFKFYSALEIRSVIHPCRIRFCFLENTVLVSGISTASDLSLAEKNESSDTVFIRNRCFSNTFNQGSGRAQSIYRLAKGWTGVQFPTGLQIVFLSQRPDRTQGPRILLSKGTVRDLCSWLNGPAHGPDL